ncbi:TetR/AcrR family transcriptional regulator [Yoonia sp.]|uniref:TetR/AcrR family transcriptional regulator n=1 Tax=Yoonia sp. TaxID=2212373 RepID=UPI0019EFA7EC|nr:TetR/AcrR family transcriptional regulator [Yoonia sp.]MBE0413830.1 TetR/AcrR family transcriptional regulator [Yoonia sp.]
MGKQGYHHGNLRMALVDSCLHLIEKQGPTGFTLSEAARGAGVTPAAVYRHFQGRDGLIAEVALQGYTIFSALLERANDGSHLSVLDALTATGRAYLAFARGYPGHYIAMFESGISIDRTPELHAAATRAMGVLERAAEHLCRQIPAENCPSSQMFSAHIWAMSHGIVALFTRGNAETTWPFAPEDLLDTGIGIYLQGLGLNPQPPTT